MYLPVDPDEFNDSILTVLKCDPLMRYEPEDEGAEPTQQLHRKTKLPVWTVTISYEHEQDFEPENCQVRITADGDPGITPGPIRFGGLAFRTWNMNGKKGLSIGADTWTQEPRPSTRQARTTATPPTPPTPNAEPTAAGKSS